MFILETDNHHKLYTRFYVFLSMLVHHACAIPTVFGNDAMLVNGDFWAQTVLLKFKTKKTAVGEVGGGGGCLGGGGGV